MATHHLPAPRRDSSAWFRLALAALLTLLLAAPAFLVPILISPM